MEYLSRLLNELKDDKRYQFHPKCAKLGVTHLSFADIYFCLPKEICPLSLHFMTVSEPSLQPQDCKLILGRAWQPLIEKITARITSWTAKKLSYAVRTQLVKSILFGMQAYWAQLFPIPAKTTRSLTNAIYYKLLPEMRLVAWKCLMFKNDARPKASFIMWLVLQGRLATADRLMRWGIIVDSTCSLCQAELETREHLFVECDYAKAIWKRLQKWLQWQQAPDEWDQHVNWAIKSAKGKSQQAQIFKLVYAECVYAIWIERNNRVFEKKARRWEEIAREIVYTCHVRAGSRVQELLQNFTF
ncbi:PREDICTED: uncharacterized protein LOC109222039 [Nicotiana attenuata]|uniref:uncharacterized protein LOC109222039 n=1 Tax=Nicotiana attenuata TaxID=49451 RepID=UPI000905115F|nr:PREDICTED: uncharacterized protein LOC109222039 [Nicotiana attenuata]